MAVFNFVFLFFLLFASPLVSAAPFGDIQFLQEQAINSIKQFFTPIFEVILGTSSFDDFFFAKILLFLLIFMVILSVLKKIEMFKEKRMGTLVSLIISVLSIRYMPEEFVGGVLLPYGTLGIAIATFLPFLVYFWFVHQSVNGGAGRRIAWIVYGIVFLFVWGTRPAGQISSASNWLYVAGFAAVFLSFSFDSSIHSYFGSARAVAITRRHKLKQLADLEHDLQKYRSIQNPSREVETIIRQLEYRYRALSSEL
ncbi:MAG: hypothetical protein AABX53_00750 [Nanoarchaeota archaeon]